MFQIFVMYSIKNNRRGRDLSKECTGVPVPYIDANITWLHITVGVRIALPYPEIISKIHVRC